MADQLVPLSPHRLTSAPFQALSDIPPEAEWFANLRNRHTRENYERDIRQFIAFAGLGSVDQLREVTRPHVLAWRDHLHGQGLANDTIRRKLAALSSLYDYLCNRHAVLHNPVLGVRRPPSMNREGATPALGDDQALLLLEAPPAGTLKGKRDRAMLAVLLYHGIRREELLPAEGRGHPEPPGRATSAHRRQAGKNSLYSARDRRAAPHHHLSGRSETRGGDGRATIPAGEEQHEQDPGQGAA